MIKELYEFVKLKEEASNLLKKDKVDPIEIDVLDTKLNNLRLKLLKQKSNYKLKVVK